MGVIFKEHGMNAKHQKFVEIVRDVICDITNCAPAEPFLREMLQPVFDLDAPEIDSPLVKRIKIERDRVVGHRKNYHESCSLEAYSSMRTAAYNAAVETLDDIIKIVKEFEKSQKK